MRGSTALELEGKGEIEIELYLNNQNWFEIIKFLIKHFKNIGNLYDEYARFNDNFKNKEIEIILMRNYHAQVDMALFDYLKSHPKTCQEYIKLKHQYAYSHKEYAWHKHLFFDKIIKSL